MSQFEQIIVTCNEWQEITFAVDNSKLTEKDWHDLNSFWSGAKSRVSEASGNVKHAVLKMLAEHCSYLQIAEQLNSYGVMKAFDWDDRQGQEGWPKMDGSKGILIQHVDSYEITAEKYLKIKKVEALPNLPKGNL
ncbi:DUF2528 family protein [Pseudoalteromonas ruthenica]|uniref:DUF2528 family protein n=1 Tax=Pseudoalteromonas ruthenica TaxID=151081 RepID=UPI00110BFE5D|nr:DUF2528 family protein [Pseudoalteromonas ruthenica]TMO97569.1 hypothetical protein CWC07_13895 [Pseudoalteromonas ruthenica]